MQFDARGRYMRQLAQGGIAHSHSVCLVYLRSRPAYGSTNHYVLQRIPKRVAVRDERGARGLIPEALDDDHHVLRRIDENVLSVDAGGRVTSRRR